MSTYVNNLRLEEIGSGERSGTWGTATNANLELIGEAFGYGTEALSNASTATITMADAASDGARAFYLKLTGALGQNCTVTLAPNTVSKIWIIENATTDSGSSGPYSTIIKQGSGGGASVTISNSNVKVVVTNGGGSGAIVYDAFTDLSLAGTTKAVTLNATTLNAVTLNASTSVQTPLIEFTDGDDAIAIADGGLVTMAKVTAIGASTAGTGAFTTLLGTTITASTALVPDVSGGADIGTASLEWGDVYLADDKQIKFGSAQDVTMEYDEDGTDTLLITGATTINGTAVIADGSNNLNIASHDGTNGLALAGTVVTSSAAELNYNDITALGTSQASKVVTADANGVVTFDNGKIEESTAVSSSSNAATINLRDGDNFTHTLSENVTYTFSNPAASGKVSAFTLKVTQDSTGRAITWPSSVDWAAATAPTITTTNAGVDVFAFFTSDGGTTYYGFTAGQAMG